MPRQRPNGPDLFARHRTLLEQAVTATELREYWTPYPQTRALVRTPLVARLDAVADRETYTREWFGPVSFIIGTDSKEHSLRIFRERVREPGALTAAVHSTSEQVPAAAESAAVEAGVHLSENLTGGVFVNQPAAFSDFHGSAAGATLSDPAFVTGRFATLQSRRPVPDEESAHA